MSDLERARTALEEILREAEDAPVGEADPWLVAIMNTCRVTLEAISHVEEAV